MTPDIINGSFELLASPFILFSILKLYKDKKVKGISWVHISYFTLWAFWNLYYYPFLNQWCSFIGGIAIMLTNTYYTGLLIYYTIKSKKMKLK